MKEIKLIKFLENTIRVNLCGLGNGFLSMTPIARQQNKKIDTLDFTKNKNFFASENIIRKMKI